MAAQRLLVHAGGQIGQLSPSDYAIIGKLNLGPGVIVTAATIIVVPNSSNILLNNPGGGTINVDFINGGSPGDIVIFRLAPGSGNTRVRKNNGNVFGGADRLFNENTDVLTLLGNGTTWTEVAWQG